jgi:type I site-specific restriction-modification system R (restriction) subunit
MAGAIEGAVEEICRDRTALSLAEANREIDKLLKQGVKVSFPDQEHGGQRVEVVSVVDWEVPENNDFRISLKATFSPAAETGYFTEIERLQNFTESTNFTAC